jgi:hypothetical protein
MPKREKNAPYWEVIEAVGCPECQVNAGEPCLSKVDFEVMGSIHRPRREIMPGYKLSKNRTPSCNIPTESAGKPELSKFKRGEEVLVEDSIYIVKTIKSLFVGKQLTLIVDMFEKDTSE